MWSEFPATSPDVVGISGHSLEDVDKKGVNAFTLMQILGSAYKSPTVPWFYTRDGINMAAFFQRSPAARMCAVYIVESFGLFEQAAFDPATDPRFQAYLRQTLAKVHSGSTAERFPAQWVSTEIGELLEEIGLLRGYHIRTDEVFQVLCRHTEELFREVDGLLGNFGPQITALRARVEKLHQHPFSLPEKTLVKENPHYCTPTKIAAQLGVLSQAGEPHGQVISGILRKLGLDTDDYRKFITYGHRGASAQYTELVIPQVQKWLAEQGWPEKVSLPGRSGERTFRVHYREREGNASQ